MKKPIRLWALALAVVFATFLVVGCTGDGTTTTTTATTGQGTTTGTTGQGTTTGSEDVYWSYELDTSPVEITNFFRARWWPNVIDEGSGWEESVAFEHIKEKTGVSYFFEVPAAAEAEVLGPMIASGTYPDMITFGSYSNAYLNQMKEAGLIYNLTELAAEYAPKLFETDLITSSMRSFFEDDDDQLWFVVGFEGNDASLDAYLSVNYVPTSGANIKYTRRDILNAWAEDDTKTWADLDSLLYFIRENFPDMDPIRLDLEFINGVFGRHFLPAFGAHLSRTYVDTTNKQLKHILKDDRAIDYFRWLNKLYRDGIITDTMIADDAQTRTDKTLAGNYGLIIDSTFGASNTINTTIRTNDGNDDRIYLALSAVSYEDGDHFKVEPLKNKGGQATVITKNCKNPDRAIRLIEYFRTEEGQVTGVLGVEGHHWEWQGNKRVMLPEPSALLSSNLGEYVAQYKTIGTFTNFATQVYWALYVDDFLTPTGPIRDEHNLVLGPHLYEIWNHGFVAIRSSLVSGSDIETVATQITEIQTSYTARMVAAKTDAEFNQLLASFLSDAESLGLSRLEAHWTQEYLKNCESFGVTPWEILDSQIPVFDLSGLELVR